MFSPLSSVLKRSLKSNAFSTTALEATALFNLHVAKGGKMVPYAGYELPVQFQDTGVKAEHLHVRNNAGLFDVSHMGQVEVIGKDKEKFIQVLTPVYLDALEYNQSSLSVLMNKEGGIMDDTVLTKREKSINLVLNGACKEKDLKHIRNVAKDYHVHINYKADYALMALQGPKAADTLQSLIGDQFEFSKLGFMCQAPEPLQISGQNVDIIRCGYTGEDGFEISVSNDSAAIVASTLLQHENVIPCGLGARDSLRLEAGLCLYGNDLDESRSVVEAGLLWVVNKARREGNMANFIGAEKVLGDIQSKPEYKRVGLVVKGAPARGHELIFNEEGEEVGVITSGGFSPCLGKAIAMGYIKRSIKLGSMLYVQVRKKKAAAEVVRMPFVPSNYYKL